MLEDELTHVLAEDRELKHLIVIDTPESQGLARKLRAQNRPFLIADLAQIPHLVKKKQGNGISSWPDTMVRMRRLVDTIRRRVYRGSSDNLVVIAYVLRLVLHVDSALLKDEVYKAIDYMSRFSDGIFMLYGVCDALRTLEGDFNDCESSLYFLTDENATRIEDCVALALGGNQPYAHFLNHERDIVVFLTPMWAASWRHLTDDLKLLKHVRFRKVAKVDTGLSYEPDFDARVDEFAQIYNLNVIQLKGCTAIIKRSYNEAKRGVCEGASFENGHTTFQQEHKTTRG